MKIERFNESYWGIPTNEEEMIVFIDNIISDNVDLRHVEYTEDDYEIDPESRNNAASIIYSKLKEMGVNFDLIYDIKKYNL